MRKVEYLSPTSLALFEKSPEEYFLRYLADNKPPYEPQNQPMAIGSAFDAYTKAYLYEGLYGKKDPKYEFKALFESQVESQNRDWALIHGKYCFEQYRDSGCLADLMLEMQNGQGEPRFEFELRGTVHGYRESNTRNIEGVTFLGKPDAAFITATGVHVILDFKVNGYCSNASPLPGYLRLRSAGRTNHGMHAKCTPMLENGMMLNIACGFEDIKKDWARQLSIYAWLCGEPVGSDFVVAIDQLACSRNPGGLPRIKIAQHRSRISATYQREVFSRACRAWEIIQSDHFFREMSREESIDRANALNGCYAAKENATPAEQWFRSLR